MLMLRPCQAYFAYAREANLIVICLHTQPRCHFFCHKLAQNPARLASEATKQAQTVAGISSANFLLAFVLQHPVTGNLEQGCQTLAVIGESGKTNGGTNP